MITPIETHPYNLCESIPNETRLLIVGTAPPPRFSNPACGGMRGDDFDFFYGSELNYMWVFLENIAQEIEGKKLFARDASSDQCCRVARDFLRRHTLWMRDILQTYQRKSRKECSPFDSDIVSPKSEHCTDFRAIFETHPALLAVAFTSEKAAEWTFRKLEGSELKRYKEEFPRWRSFSEDKALKDYIEIKYKRPLLEANGIRFYILPSPTARSRQKGFSIKIKQNIYRAVLFAG